MCNGSEVRAALQFLAYISVSLFRDKLSFVAEVQVKYQLWAEYAYFGVNESVLFDFPYRVRRPGCSWLAFR